MLYVSRATVYGVQYYSTGTLLNDSRGAILHELRLRILKNAELQH